MPKVKLIQPYDVPRNPNGVGIEQIRDGRLFFEGRKTADVITEHTYQVSETLRHQEEQIMIDLQDLYPQDLIYAGAYMIGHTADEKNIISLQSQPLSMVSIPGGKAHDVSVLAKVVAMRWNKIHKHLPSTDVHAILERLQTKQTPQTVEQVTTTTCVPFQKTATHYLGLHKKTVYQYLEKKWGSKGIHEEQWMEKILSSTDEKILDALYREVEEETGCSVIDHELLFVLLTRKYEHVLKVNFFYSGEVSQIDTQQQNLTYTEKLITKIIPQSLPIEATLDQATELLAKKLGVKGYTYEGITDLQQEKSAAAVGYHIALQAYQLLTQK